MSETKRTTEQRLAELEAWRSLAADALARHEAALKDAETDLREHTTSLGDHERQIAKLRLLVADISNALERLQAEVTGIHTRLDRHEEYHEDTTRKLVAVGIALHEAKEGRRAEHLELKDLILVKLAPRGETDLRAQVAGLTALRSADERTIDDQARRIAELEARLEEQGR